MGLGIMRRPYTWTSRLSVAWVLLLAGLILFGQVVLWVQDRSAETVCETTARAHGLNDGCQ
ncbi:hypothetical protein RDJLphi1_gp58 [Roseobacter phage RDJL Phi 1]|uniref:Uncharacterized protein n=1 Tax=Roseobacter phage RDJL Phi 1 TaxID=562742 RepID=F4YXR9_9CAUD|nr:hypothetical protein RDJLphi1_gp58 [Roseobacter phage RDJL Phi 1]ADK73459.1 hypothetical protein RDJLphi1_gp58 [Roseobacter phage RDJL Phi 1]